MEGSQLDKRCNANICNRFLKCLSSHEIKKTRLIVNFDTLMSDKLCSQMMYNIFSTTKIEMWSHFWRSLLPFLPAPPETASEPSGKHQHRGRARPKWTISGHQQTARSLIYHTETSFNGLGSHRDENETQKSKLKAHNGRVQRLCSVCRTKRQLSAERLSGLRRSLQWRLGA